MRGEDEDEDEGQTRPGRVPPRATVEADRPPVTLALASLPEPSVDLGTPALPLPAGPEPVQRYLATCFLGDKQVAVEVDGASLALVLMNAVRLDLTSDEALTLAKALIRAASLVRS